MAWLIALVTGGLNNSILRKVEMARAEPVVEIVQGGNVFAKKMHPAIMFPVKSPFMQLAVKKRHRISAR